MGITDKITGRVKQAAGDVLGDEDLTRQGKQEERKGDAKAELERERIELEKAEAQHAARRDEAEQRAAAAARREFDKAEREISQDETALEARRERFERRASELDSLETSTSTETLRDTHTKDELYDRAAQLGVEGRSEMTKDQLADEIRRRS